MTRHTSTVRRRRDGHHVRRLLGLGHSYSRTWTGRIRSMRLAYQRIRILRWIQRWHPVHHPCCQAAKKVEHRNLLHVRLFRAGDRESPNQGLRGLARRCRGAFATGIRENRDSEVASRLNDGNCVESTRATVCTLAGVGRRSPATPSQARTYQAEKPVMYADAGWLSISTALCRDLEAAQVS